MKRQGKGGGAWNMSGVAGEEGYGLEFATRLSGPLEWVASMQQISSSGVVGCHDVCCCSSRSRVEEPMTPLRPRAPRQ